MKLTKNEIRFSHSIRPDVGEIVEFDPVILLLTKDVVVADVRTFISDYMTQGAKCRVVKNDEFVVEVEFLDDKALLTSPDLVSPSYLIKRELTDEAVEMIEKLKKRLNIGD